MDPQFTIERAAQAVQRGDKMGARVILNEVLKHDPTNEQAYLMWADVADNPQHQRHCLEQVLKINPNNSSAHQQLARLNTLSRFLNEEQNPTIVEQVHSRVLQILTVGEEIEYIAVQQKPLLNIAPDCFVLTNRRFIIYRPKLLGGVDFEDYIWRDLRDARLKEGLMGATLTLQTVDGRVLALDYLPKTQARRLYSLAQAMEERVREERRTRELEEKRAAAGGIVLQAGVPSPIPAPTPAANIVAPIQEDPVQTLKKLKDMLAADLITQQEYDAKKTEILSRM